MLLHTVNCQSLSSDYSALWDCVAQDDCVLLLNVQFVKQDFIKQLIEQCQSRQLHYLLDDNVESTSTIMNLKSITMDEFVNLTIKTDKTVSWY